MAWESSVLAIVAIAGVVLTAIKTFWDIRKDRDTTREMLTNIQSMRRAIDSIRKEIKKLQEASDNRLTSTSKDALEQRRQALREQELQMEKEKQNWLRLVDVARGIKWYINKSDEE